MSSVAVRQTPFRLGFFSAISATLLILGFILKLFRTFSYVHWFPLTVLTIIFDLH